MYFLRFPDEQAYLDAIAPYSEEEGNVTIPDWDVIGIIYEGGEYDDEGNVLVEPIPIDGWHVNAISVPESMEQYVIDRPGNPYRVFAGH